MPAKKTYRQGAGQQRHHRHRLHRLLVPHGGVSGLLFTANPRQEAKALRELRLHLHPLTADLEGRTAATDRRPQEGPAPSTSTLLAAELAEYVTASETRRHERITPDFAESGSDDADEEEECDGENAETALSPPRKRPRHAPETAQREGAGGRCQWLAPLETGCKGYIMISIPFPPNKKTTCEEKTDGECDKSDDVDEVNGMLTPCQSKSDDTEPQSIAKGDIPHHTILCNPIVQIVVERLFRDIEENPRPLMRHCFRLVPCELTCCPTLPEMRIALERLLAEHFPQGDGPNRLHRVGLSFKVKNNTGVEGKRAQVQAALEAMFPVNRFVLIPLSRVKSCDIQLEAVFCVFVLHATCVMGVQRRFAERGEYNLHAIGVKHLELSSSV